MTLPIVEQVTFLPWWLQSRVSKNVAKGKTCCCWLLLVNVWFEHIWIKEVNYHLSMESHFWSLNIEMVSSIYKCVKSNLCRIQIHSGTVCGIRFGWYFQHATSRLFCLFFLSENMHRWTDGFFPWTLWGFSVCFDYRDDFIYLFVELRWIITKASEVKARLVRTKWGLEPLESPLRKNATPTGSS